MGADLPRPARRRTDLPHSNCAEARAAVARARPRLARTDAITVRHSSRCAAASSAFLLRRAVMLVLRIGAFHRRQMPRMAPKPAGDLLGKLNHDYGKSRTRRSERQHGMRVWGSRTVGAHSGSFGALPLEDRAARSLARATACSSGVRARSPACGECWNGGVLRSLVRRGVEHLLRRDLRSDGPPVRS